ncbi:MAG: pyridoxamine 5'-phosphate oxidase family protein [Deltaproteobacteria bacterium]|nr:pyridoxamine 5'-phosphate oxidase family protein [Deltaproteobacteria bacterium]
MRRTEKEIKDKTAIEAIIHKSTVCRLGLSDGYTPYIVPVCFGYQDHTIYVHGSPKGKKIEMIQKNQYVCIEFDINITIVEAERACDWGVKYQSVIGFGKASFLKDRDEKRRALNIIMSQYSEQTFQFPEKVLSKTAVIKIEVDRMTGKQSGC